MKACIVCSEPFEAKQAHQRYCSGNCKNRAYRYGLTIPASIDTRAARKAKCSNCQKTYTTIYNTKLYCSKECKVEFGGIVRMGRSIEKRATEGTFEPHRSRRWRQAYSTEEIAALRADPRCMLPNRNLRSQWKKCHELGIPRDHDLRVVYERPPEVSARARARMKLNPEQLRVYWRRSNFRRSVRTNPEGVLDELRCLARGYQHAEDIILEGFATVLRLAIPAAEAFKIAKAEVNRTSAQPFKEQSFNPEIDYEARETGRQAARASDIRAARGEG